MTQKFIHYSCQFIEEDDIEAVVRALRSDWLTQGPTIDQFEKSITDYCHAPHGIAVSSATAGLHLACLALDIGAGDSVWTSPMSFVASSNCALYVGATVDFVDIDPDTGNMCPKALAAKLEEAERAGRLPKLVIPVHFSGRTCDMAAIGKLKEKYRFKIVEDAAHALGACYKDGSPVGSSPHSEATIFSFHPVKPVTTGEGGVIVTHSAPLAAKLRMLRTHGITRDPALWEHKNMPAWYSEQQMLGYNYRITDIQAALGVSQMTKLERFTNARRAMAERYHHALKALSLRLPPPDAHSSWHLYTVQLDRLPPHLTRDQVFQKLRDKKIGVNVHYLPIHLHPYYRGLGFKEGQFPKAEAFFRNVLSLPLHPRLTAEDQQYVIDCLAEYCAPSQHPGLKATGR